MEKVCLKGQKMLALCVLWRAVRSVRRESKAVSNISLSKLFSCGWIQTMGKGTTRFGRLHFIDEYLSGLLQVFLLLPQYGSWTRQSVEIPPNPTSLW